MKDDQKDQKSVNESKEHRASVSTERAAEAADSQSGQPMKIERLVLSIATNQFTVPLPTGKEVVNAVNAHDALVAALISVTRELDEIVNVTSRAIDQCKGNFASRMVPSFLAIEEARAALALANIQDANTLASSGKSSPSR